VRDYSFTLRRALVPSVPAFAYRPMRVAPWLWLVTDGQGQEVGRARTRAGARAAVHALYGWAGVVAA
jgi:hypothetical protein